MADTNKELKTEIGQFMRWNEGCYTFEMKDDIIIFEGISRVASSKYNLQDYKHLDATFEVTYSESLGDLDDDDFIIFTIEDLKLL